MWSFYIGQNQSKFKISILSRKSMQPSQLKLISEDFFAECQILHHIQKPFTIDQIAEQQKIRDLENQFELIRALTQTKKHRMRLRSNTVRETKKNRYPQQAIFQHSRIVLFDLQGDTEDGYINANEIPLVPTTTQSDFKLILTQGPTENTIKDFNKMIVQQKIECVVMLCRLMENGKSRCSDYLESKNFIKADCSIQKQEKLSDYLSTRTINLGEIFDQHCYQHVYYSEWPDKKVPSELAHISELIGIITKHKRILIHCSAGLGRSGVIAALLLILKSDLFLQQSKLSIFQTVRRMRQYRFGAVQNSEQYSFLYEYFVDFHKNKLV